MPDKPPEKPDPKGKCTMWFYREVQPKAECPNPTDPKEIPFEIDGVVGGNKKTGKETPMKFCIWCVGGCKKANEKCIAILTRAFTDRLKTQYADRPSCKCSTVGKTKGSGTVDLE